MLETQLAAAFANAHACPHEAQFAVLLVVSVSQPLLVIPSQSPRPAAQLERVHTPAVHDAPPPENMQTFPHELQLFTLVCVFVSQPSEVSPLQSPKPVLQLRMPHVPAAQRGVALAITQALAQLPQRVGSVLMFTSQPSAAMPLQFA